MKKNNSILFFLPFGPPSSGGCAQYYEYLRKNLSELSEHRNVHVFTDRVRVRGDTLSKTPDQKYVRRILVGFSRYKNRYIRGLAFRAQMLQLLILMARYCLLGKDNIYVLHSGYFSKNIFFCVGLKILCTFFRNLRVVIDFRDTSVSEIQLNSICSIIAGAIFCSVNITRAYEEWFESRNKTCSYIPVPFEPTSLGECDLPPGAENLLERDYIFFPSGIDRHKGFFLLEKAVGLMRERGEEVTLIVAGRNTAGQDSEIGLPPFVSYLGPVSNVHCRALMEGARYVVCLGANEGLPRICLEAISMGARVLAPFGVPEMAALCAPAPTPELTPEKVAALLNIDSDSAINHGSSYDLTPHSFRSVNQKYKNFFRAFE